MVNKRATLVDRGLPQMNEASSATETNQADFVVPEEEDKNGRNYLQRRIRARSTRGQVIMRGHCTNQIHSSCLGLAFPRTYESIAQS